MAFKKTKRVIGAIVQGNRDYAETRQRLMREAEKSADSGTGSVNADVHNHAKELDRLMREQHVTWLGSVKNRYYRKSRMP